MLNNSSSRNWHAR